MRSKKHVPRKSRTARSEWRTAFANAHKSPREEPPGYDTLQIAQLLSRFVDYLHANFYSYQCRQAPEPTPFWHI